MKLALADHMSETGIDKWIAELGVVSAPLPRAGVKESLQYFQRYMPRLPADLALEFIRAMDLSKPVKPVLLQKGEPLIAFRTSAESPFKVFYTRPGRSKHSSGINPEGRSVVRFTVNSTVWALESHTTAAIDTWTRRAAGQVTTVAPRQNSTGVMAFGGGLQLIIPESYSHLLVRSP